MRQTKHRDVAQTPPEHRTTQHAMQEVRSATVFLPDVISSLLIAACFRLEKL